MSCFPPFPAIHDSRQIIVCYIIFLYTLIAYIANSMHLDKTVPKEQSDHGSHSICFQDQK